ncbi:hypothetical protein TNCV_562981 [Trichonephila clavipes]|nr:hypothetical protein TNCV_562981 [Trichonephila clavipes]
MRPGTYNFFNSTSFTNKDSLPPLFLIGDLSGHGHPWLKLRFLSPPSSTQPPSPRYSLYLKLKMGKMLNSDRNSSLLTSLPRKNVRQDRREGYNFQPTPLETIKDQSLKKKELVDPPAWLNNVPSTRKVCKRAVDAQGFISTPKHIKNTGILSLSAPGVVSISSTTVVTMVRNEQEKN